ncbi:hypothetical protein L484_002638 [Morus notabilis]|uniref:Uncharacterized protein n=1 Tax=Morus notabilis TaxID=981085 RepID=W9S542_9ROSA|nr:hypothetical protein L484_002638 [Morus notabilis]
MECCGEAFEFDAGNAAPVAGREEITLLVVDDKQRLSGKGTELMKGAGFRGKLAGLTDRRRSDIWIVLSFFRHLLRRPVLNLAAYGGFISPTLYNYF